MKIQFILVEPAVPENIGASARALKTMGFNCLLLVNPCSWKEGKAKWLAHGSSEILENALVYQSLADALHGTDIAIATSAKHRTVKRDYIPAKELYSFLTKKIEKLDTISIVFGREESGLKNEEMALCDVTSSIDMALPYPSLNLAQAVMLYAYELSKLNIQEPISVNDTVNVENSFSQLRRKIRELLRNIGIEEDDNRYGRIMERISFLDKDDINLLHTVTSKIAAKINEPG